MTAQDDLDRLIRSVARQVDTKVAGAHTETRRGVVTAVAGGEVTFTVPNPTGMGTQPNPGIRGRWVGATAPKVVEVVTYIDDGSGYPIVLGPTGRDALGALSTWTSYAPTWTADADNPVLANGTIQGRYIRAAQWCMVEIRVKGGALTYWGSGLMYLGLPVASANNGDGHRIDGFVFDSGIGWTPLMGLIPAGTALVHPMYQRISNLAVGGHITLGYLTATQPVNMGDADAIILSGTYRTV